MGLLDTASLEHSVFCLMVRLCSAYGCISQGDTYRKLAEVQAGHEQAMKSLSAAEVWGLHRAEVWQSRILKIGLRPTAMRLMRGSARRGVACSVDAAQPPACIGYCSYISWAFGVMQVSWRATACYCVLLRATTCYYCYY